MIETESKAALLHQDKAAHPLGGVTAHILPTSATMIGVCVAVLSIGHFGPGGKLHVVIDKLLALDALMFLASAVLSFMSLRSARSTLRLEARAEMIFIGALSLLAFGTVVLAFVIN